MTEAPHNIAPAQAVRRWVESVIVKYNLCPFARAEVDANAIAYVTSTAANVEQALAELQSQFVRLDDDSAVATTLIIYPGLFADFDDYLSWLDLANIWLVQAGYEGVYQIASFHPDYQFANTVATAAENYTNRSPWPILHLLREDQLEIALEAYQGDPEEIPERNRQFAERKGADFFVKLIKQCLSAQSNES